MRTLICVFALFALNLGIAWRVVRIEYTTHMWSIEGAYIGLARYIRAHWGDLDWFPLWYGGIPFHDTYPPLFHYLAAGVAGVTSPAHAYHVVCALAYAMGAVTLFLLVRALSQSDWVALAAAGFFSLVSPSAVLMRTVRHDMGGVGHARRFMALAEFGEGPHVLSLTLVPLALLALHVLLEQPSAWRLALAAFAYAAVALTNWLGSFTLGLGTLILLVLHRPGHVVRWVPPVCVLAYALAGPWIPPSTIRLVRQNAQIVGGAYQLTGVGLTVFALLVALALGVTWWLRTRRAVAFGAGFTILTAGICLAKEWASLVTFPQPERYHLAMEMGLAILLGIGWRWGFQRAPVALGVATGLLAGYQARDYRQFARSVVKPLEIRETVEYQAGKWMGENLTGQRAFVGGSTGFWLNAFGDTAQFKGGFDQGQPYASRHDANFAIPYIRGNGAVTAKWLRAYGNQAVLVSGQDTRDAFRDWQDPLKFEGLLPVIWANGDDRIYRLPGSSSLAHVIRPGEAVATGPFNWQGSEKVDAFVSAIDDPTRTPARLRWLTQSSFEVEAEMGAGEVLSIQVNHHPGWTASVKGKILPTRADGLGFLLVEPLGTGAQRILLSFNGGAEAQWMRGAQMGAMLAMAGFAIHQFVRQRRA